MSPSRPITLHQPARVETGAGSAARVGAWAAGAERILVLTSRSVRRHLDRLHLPDPIHVIDDVPPEPDDQALARILATATGIRPDLVIGLGGGSVMDVAKLICVLQDGAQSLGDIVGPNRVARRSARLALVPTTAGTGSEAGIRALITSSETGAKMAVESPLMCADLAILDPELTYTVPSAVTAATGIDAMAHCVEAFTSKRAHAMIDGYARMGIALVGRHLERAVADGQDTEAREGMMRASYYGGICLGPVNTAAGHATAYPLGTRLHLPHGLANAIMFPHVLAFNAPAAQDRTAEILSALGLAPSDDPERILASAHGFCQSLGIVMRLSAHGAQETDLAAWAAEAHAIRRLMDNNPREMSAADILSLYRAAF